MPKIEFGDLYVKGARVWIKDNELVWKGCKLAADLTAGLDQIALILDDESPSSDTSEDEFVQTEFIFNIKKNGVPLLRNPDVLLAENDLTALSFLHEAAVLNSLKERFVHREHVYTYCGIVLVAINPYKACPIYDQDFIDLYRERDNSELDPHIYSIANNAFTNMNRFGEDQSIIVTGESGAGKTVSAKFSMKYFAAVGGSSKNQKATGGNKENVEHKVLASNPIMEAIGNAKTTRNDNSSRFGKYIELNFDSRNRICGGQMRTYLLEKSRVVRPGPDERNYHIFYQLVAAAQADPQNVRFPNEIETELAALHLGEITDYNYLVCGDCIQVDNIDDAKEFRATQYALTLLGVGSKQQSLILRVLASILHLGNVELHDTGSDSTKVDVNCRALSSVCELLGVEQTQLAQWLCHRRIQTVGDVFDKPLRIDEAITAKDSLAKHIYAQLFDMIVDQINSALITKTKSKNTIGVLDIYGFETFDVNSFEQFCINYANEKLQQQFCCHVFKLEQEEYQREKLNWTKIEFYDNQPCIDLIENKLGILDLLDEECKMPKGGDETWARKMYERHLKKHKNFDKPRTSNVAFIINHFADRVTYQVVDFVSKNRDSVNEEQVAILKASKFDLVSTLFKDKAAKKEAPAKPGARNKNLKKTVGRQFSESLKSLMAKLNSTTPHYVRCIKPNDDKAEFTFNLGRAVEQLRACGVLETVRLSAAGFPGRWTYKDFRTRYRVLLNEQEAKLEPRKSCEVLLKRLIPEDDKYAFGKTKIFFRAGQVAMMEKWRIDRLNKSAAIIQRFVKMFIYRRKYLRIRQLAIMIQRAGRRYLAIQRAKILREKKAATIIQCWWRMLKARKRYTRLKRGVMLVQAKIRQKNSHQLMIELREGQAATVIQAAWRGHMARKYCANQLRRIVRVQCLWRVKKARSAYRELKREARNVDNMKALNKGLENKIMELKRKFDEKSELNKQNELKLQKAIECGALTDGKISEIVIQLGEVSAQRDDLLQENKKKSTSIEELNAQIHCLENRLKSAEARADTSEASMADLQDAGEKQRERADTLTEELEKVKAQSSIKISEYKRSASQGMDTSNEIYQRQLTDKEAELETIQVRYANLSEELQLSRHHAEEEEENSKAKINVMNVELTHFKKENEILLQDLEDIKQAAVTEGGVDAVLRQQLDMANEEVKNFKLEAVERQQQQADAKARKRHVETNTPEMDVAMIKSLTAQIKNQDIDLGLVKDALYSDSNTSELVGEINKLSIQNQKLEKLCRKLNKKLRLSEKQLHEIKNTSQFPTSKSTPALDMDKLEGASVAGSLISNDDSDELERQFGDNMATHMPTHMPTHRLSAQRQGVIKFSPEQLNNVIDAIMATANKVQVPRCGAAYLLFMSLRHTDNTNDDGLLKNLLIQSINGLKKMGKRNERTVPGITMWTCISIRLTHLIFQYSGEPDACSLNTVEQNNHILKNFDINEFRSVFSDTSTILYKKMISIIQDKIKPMVISSMLDHDSLHGNTSGKSIESSARTPYSIQDLMRELGTHLDLAKEFGCDDVVIKQILRQLIYFVVSISLNQLLVRRDLCNWTKAMQLRYNVSQIEEFLSRRNMRENIIIKELNPLVQSSQLMQVKKQDEKDATQLLQMCDSLTGAQVLKLLQLITPVHEYEEVVPARFLSLIKSKTSKNPGITQRDLTHIFPAEFPYVPSDIVLTELELPSEVRKYAQLV